MMLRLPYVQSYRDRHGVLRCYVRRKGRKRVALKGEPGSPEWMAAYYAALDDAPAPKVRRVAAGSFAALIAEFYAAPEFRRLKESTRRTYRGIIDRFAAEHGHRLVKDLRREDVRKIYGRMAETPAAANNWLRMLRLLIKFAIDLEWRDTDPTRGIKGYAMGEHRAWTDDEARRFEARWPIGARERLLFDLALYTGQRRGDLVRMAWSDFDGATIRVVQEKTGARLRIRAHRNLIASLNAADRSHLVILATAFGRPFSAKGIGNWFKHAVRLADLPEDCVLHGLRKAAGKRMAEAGCSAKEIAAVLGHATLKEVARYTAEADQEHLAAVAVKRLEQAGNKRVSNRAD